MMQKTSLFKKLWLVLLAYSCVVVFDSDLIAQEQKLDPKTDKTVLEIVKESPDAIPLEPRDPTKNVSDLFRDPRNNPKREYGPINIQKSVGGFYYQGIPTFFRAPVALGPEDLKAGKVEVAIMGASFDMSTSMRGTAWGPQAVRTGEVGAMAWGEVFALAHPTVGEIDFMQELTVVDYGDAPIDPLSTERSLLSVHRMVKEIAETGAIPVIVGGDHSLMYPDVVAVTDVYGKGKDFIKNEPQSSQRRQRKTLSLCRYFVHIYTVSTVFEQKINCYFNLRVY
jgi:agmatinase